MTDDYVEFQMVGEAVEVSLEKLEHLFRLQKIFLNPTEEKQGLSDDERAYRELIELLLPNGKCDKFQTCTHPDKDDYYCHDSCPWIPDFETWLEELEELRARP